MKKSILIFSLLILLSSCGTPSSNSSSINKEDTIEDVLSSLNNNYSVNYTSSRGKYNIYKTENYIYDEELGGGQFVLYDDTMYIYTVHNNEVVPRVPFYGFKEDFDLAYPSFVFDKEKYVVENDTYITTDEETVERLSLLINSTGYVKASLFLDSGFLNFRFYNRNDKVEVTGKVYAIGNTTYAPVETYLNNNIDPELEVSENKPLVEALKSLNDNFTFVGLNNTTKAGIALLINEDYVASFTGTNEDKEDYYGYISLEDGTHYFEIKNGITNVDFEISAEKDFIKDNYFFKRHDFTKFKNIGENTYISSDYYNVKNFIDLLTLEDEVCNLVKIKVNEDNTITLDLMYNHYSVYTGTFYDIENSKIDELVPYVNKEVLPDLPRYENAALLEATKDLDLNFTYVNEHYESENENEFFGVYSSVHGRKEYKPEYNNFPSTDYIVYDDCAFSYVLDEYKVSPKYYDYLSREDYDRTYSFKAIDFAHFKLVGENKWMTNSLKYIYILSKLLGSNPYEGYHFQATVEIKDGKLYFEIMDSYFTVNTTGYLKDINTTQVDIINEYNESNSKPSRPNNDNSVLKPYIDALKNDNFTTKYHDDEEYGLFFDETDYDYWTEDTLYMGTYESGFVTSSKSKYMYEYAVVTDDETNIEYLAISSHPSLYLSSISDFNPFHRFDDEKINSLIPYEDGYISFDNEIISIAVEALNLQDVLAYITFVGVFIKIENDSLVISVMDEIKVTYDELGKRNEEYVKFATASFINVGTTQIPDFAIIPSMK